VRGTLGGPADRARAPQAAARGHADPDAAPHAGVAYRRHLVNVLLRRVLEEVT
jgi:CO/xanthine dehydrogenase FAD-binding subunit